MSMADNYTEGQQPCGSYNPAREGNGAITWIAIRSCSAGCGSTVSFCENCSQDHHYGGFEECVKH